LTTTRKEHPMTDHPVTESVAAALVALSSALATLTREIQHTQGFSAALADRIAALEAKAAMPTVIPTTTALAARGPELTTFERIARPVRDGQW
jgi:hypothetical protein